MTHFGWVLALALVATGCTSPSYRGREADSGHDAQEPRERDARAPSGPDASAEDAGGPDAPADARVEPAAPTPISPTGKTAGCVVGVSKIGECTL